MNSKLYPNFDNAESLSKITFLSRGLPQTVGPGCNRQVRGFLLSNIQASRKIIKKKIQVNSSLEKHFCLLI